MILAVELEIADIAPWRDRTDGAPPSFLTPAEVERCAAAADTAASIAARRAAKQAVLRALGLGDVDLDVPDQAIVREVEIRSDDHGRPRVHLTGTARAAADRAGVSTVHVSLTHGVDRAGALAVLER